MFQVGNSALTYIAMSVVYCRMTKTVILLNNASLCTLVGLCFISYMYTSHWKQVCYCQNMSENEPLFSTGIYITNLAYKFAKIQVTYSITNTCTLLCCLWFLNDNGNTMFVQVVCALASARPIITPRWLESAILCFTEKKVLPPCDRFVNNKRKGRDIYM